MNYQLINRFVSGDKTYYDILISDDVGTERFNSVKVVEGGEDELVNSLYNNILYRRTVESNRAEILQTVSDMEQFALNEVRHGRMDLTKMATLNAIITTNLSPLGISIDTPDLIGIFCSRIQDTIGKVNELYNNIEVTDEVKAATMSTIQEIAQVLNGNA